MDGDYGKLGGPHEGDECSVMGNDFYVGNVISFTVLLKTGSVCRNENLLTRFYRILPHHPQHTATVWQSSILVRLISHAWESSQGRTHCVIKSRICIGPWHISRLCGKRVVLG